MPFTRRELIIGASASLAGLAVGKAVENFHVFREPTELQTVQQLEREIAIRFDINFSADVRAGYWHKQELDLLESSLDRIPRHFYRNESKGLRLKIIRENRGEYLSPHEYAIQIFPDQFLPENYPQFRFHETFLEKLVDLWIPRNHPDGLSPAGWTPWVLNVERILGKKLSELRNPEGELYQRIEEKYSIFNKRALESGGCDRLEPEVQEKCKFYSDMSSTLGRPSRGRSGDNLTPSDLERYRDSRFVFDIIKYALHGYNFFAEALSEFFPPQTVNNLYYFIYTKILTTPFQNPIIPSTPSAIKT